MSTRKQPSSVLRRATSIVAFVVSGLVAPCVLADSRPFGVLPEGAISITRPALGTGATVLHDGRLVIHGTHDRIDGVPHSDIAVLRPDGSLDRSFRFDCLPRPGKAQGPACRGSTVALPDGGFVLGGSFEEVNGLAIARLVRFGRDGSLIPSFQPLAGITNLRSARVIQVNGAWLYLVLDVDGSTSLRRVSLDSGVMDPGFIATNPAFDLAITAADRVYEMAQVPGTLTFRLRRRQPDGSVDSAWQSGIGERAGLAGYDPLSDRLFVTTESDDGLMRVRRVHPETGVEPGWVAELPATGSRRASMSIAAMTPGRLLTRITEQPGPIQTLAVLATTNGALLGSRPEPTRARAYYPGRGDHWYVAVEAADDPVVPDGGSFIRLFPDLRTDPAFVSRSRRAGIVGGAAITPDGGVIITGEFTRVGDTRVAGIARLAADYSVRLDWPAGPVPVPWPGSVAISRDDIVLVRSAPPQTVIFPPGIVPIGFVALTPGAGAFRVHRPPGGHFEIGPDGRLYSIDAPCPAATGPQPAIGRIDLPLLVQPPAPGMPWPPCFSDASWAVPGGSRVVDFATSEGGWLYFLERDDASQQRDLRVRRIGLASGSSIDPGFAPVLGVEPGQTRWVQSRISADADFVYLGGDFTRIDGQAASGLVRLHAASGELDPGWPALPIDALIAGTANDATHAYLAALRFTPGEPGTASVSSGRVVRRATVDGLRVDTLDASAFSRPFASTPSMSITPFGDGRLLVVGAFRVLDGQSRDGFAIVGSVEAIMTDSFEATP